MQPTPSDRHRILSSRYAVLLCAVLPAGCLWDALIDDPETTSGASTSTGASDLPTTAETPTSGSSSPDTTTGSPSTSPDGDTSGNESTGAVTSGVDTETTETSTFGETSSTSEASDTSSSSSTSDTTTGGPVCDQVPGAPGSTIAVARLHGLGTQFAHDVAIDDSGNIYVVGSFTNELLIDNVAQPQPDPVTGQRVAAPFISKFACDGTHEWTKVGTTNGTSSARSLVISDSQDVFMTGNFTKTLTFPGASPLDPNQSSTVFVAKVSPTGDFMDTGTLAFEAAVGNAIVRDGNDNLYIAGGCSTGGKTGILMAKLTPELGTTALKCLPGGTASSAALTGNGIIIGGTMNTDLIALSACTPVNKPSDNKVDGFVAKVLLDLSNTATGSWCTSIASTSGESVDDLVVSLNTVTAVGYSVDGPNALKTSAGCEGTIIGDHGAFAAPMNTTTGDCGPANYYPGDTNRIWAIDATGGGTQYLAGQFAGVLKNLNASTQAFFVAKDPELTWAKQTVPVGMTMPVTRGTGVAITDRVATVGYITEGDVDYDGLDAGGTEDSFLVVLWP